MYNCIAMGDYASDAYDKLWTQVSGIVSPVVQQRINETLAAIPADCTSVLDVGCGDGKITNLLACTQRTVMAIDVSRQGLRHVATPRAEASVSALPFRSRGFHTVLCTEVLEHIPFPIYPQALAEIARVSAKCILLTVPNGQDLRCTMVTCPHCGCRFQPDRHLRTFSQAAALGAMFPGFHLEATREIGPRRVYPPAVRQLAAAFGVASGGFPHRALCPQCGYSTEVAVAPDPNRLDGVQSSLLRLLKRVVPRSRKAAWLLALYRRDDEDPSLSSVMAHVAPNRAAAHDDPGHKKDVEHGASD